MKPFSSWGVAAAAAAAAAAAVAVAISVGTTLPALLSEGDGGPVPAKEAGRALALDNLSVGAEPLGGYLAGTEFRRGAERLAFTLEPGMQVTELVALSGGYLLSTSDARGKQHVRFVADDGNSSGAWEVERDSFFPTVVASRDGRLGAFVQLGGKTVVVQDDGRTVTEFAAPKGTLDIGFGPLAVSGTDCTGAEADCAVLVHGVALTGGDGTRATTWTLRPGRPPETGPDGFRELRTVAANGYSAGIVKIIEDGDGACAGVADVDGSVLWTTCKDRLISFSPDSKWVLASTSALFGSGDHELTLLNARTGKEKLRLKTAEDVGIYEMVWEDKDHVLAVVSDWQVDPETEDHLEHRWAVVRINLDGTREYAVAPVPGRDDDFDGPLDLPRD